jgi:plasmid maintenance system antidote protein VapI
LISDEKSNWKDKAEFRRTNKKWLDRSSAIALMILSHLRENSISQKELAEMINVTPQYINKIVKGNENLTLQTIANIEAALGISLINVVSFENKIIIEKQKNIPEKNIRRKSSLRMRASLS